MTDSIYAEAARGYIDAGLAVIPLREGEKLPATKHGLNNWSDNPGQVGAWWGKRPEMNVGIVCGTPSHGLGVIDVDVHGADGREWLREWQIAHGELPETWTVRTGSGGLQYYYRFREVPPNSANGSIGVDFRGEGGYVVAPPSLHPCGELYEWSVSPEDCDIADADESVMALVAAIRPSGEGRAPEADARPRFELRDVVREGEGRNEHMFSYARSLLSRGLDAETVKSIVRDANRTHCLPPIKKAELEKTLASACSKDPGNEWRRAPERPAVPEGLPDWHKYNKENKVIGIKPFEFAQAVTRASHALNIDGSPGVWTGRHWDFGKEPAERAMLALDTSASSQCRRDTYDLIKMYAEHVTAREYFEPGLYVQFRNVTIDAMTLEEVEPRPTMQIYGELPIDFDLEVARRPNYADEFMDAVSAGDSDVKLCLGEIIAACMASRVVVPQVAFLIGRADATGRGRASNGKSTFENWVRAIVGTANACSVDLTDFGRDKYAPYSLLGRLANIGDDIPSDFLRQDTLALFKKLATGETISCDVKYSSRHEFRPVAAHVYSMNEVPMLERATEGELRRIQFVPFRSRFEPGTPGYDPDVASKLATPEAKMRGAYMGLRALPGLVARGRYVPIPDMQAELDAIRFNTDSVARWLADSEKAAEELDGMTFADAYAEYARWCESNDERYRVKKNKFVEKLNTCGWFGDRSFSTTRAKVAGHQVTYLVLNGPRKA